MFFSLPNTVRALTPLIIALSVSGCGESALQEGGGAGDGSGNGGSSTDEAIALLTPLAGIYDLQDNWNGQSGDEAFLSIGSPNANGESVASLYDFDDIDNCIPERPLTGVVSIEPIDQRIFMDNLLLFFQAEITLSNSSLIIEFEDLNDINNNGSTIDSVTIEASRSGMSLISDHGDQC